MGYVLKNPQAMEVDLDLENPEHCKAIKMITTQGRQHPTLRFKVDFPYQDLPSMATSKILERYFSEMERKHESNPTHNPGIVRLPRSIGERG